MRRVLLVLCTLALALPTSWAFAQGGEKGSDEGELLRRSIDTKPFDGAPPGTTTTTASAESYPGGPLGKSPLSTGYYITDNDAPPMPALWTPTYQFVDTTGLDARTWRRIASGPNQRPMSEWTEPTSQGFEFFRNPTVPNDSTDNAFAGPMNIGFPFYYYGRAYDSFYVSTNGLVALANRRYQYDDAGNRIDYNPFRDDTLVRPRVGANAQADPTPDNYGFQYVAMGNTASPLGGVRSPDNAPFPVASLRNVIAPLWDDNELSQFDTTTGLTDDFGRVYWRRDIAGNRLIIYFVNLSMKGSKAIPLINQMATVPRRTLRANVQVVLDRVDSSIQFNYVRFLGQYIDPVQRILTIPTSQMYRANGTIGIQSNPDVPAPYTGATGAEWTNYQYNDIAILGGTTPVGDAATTPHAGLAIKFRQWKNVVRVMTVDFQIPDRNNATQFVKLPTGSVASNYELLLGNPLLGVIRPIGIVQNTSDSIGPVNRSRQPVLYNIIFRIRDIVNCTDPPVYQKTKTTDTLHPIRLTNKRSIDTVIFDPYVTNAQLIKQAGRFRAEVIATDRGPNGEVYGEMWPFDDTTGVRIFGIFRQELPYITTFNDFSVSCEDGVIPPVRRWVSIGVQVVDGDQNTWNPVPPRGPANGSNGNLTLQSPVAKMDRQTIEGSYYQPATQPRGDTLISFPINLSLSRQPVMFLSYQRAGRQVYPRAWSDQVRLGPEHATYNVLKNTLLQLPDYMMVEFAEPSPNGIDNVVNVKNWRQTTFADAAGSPRWQQVPGNTGSTSPRWGVFGGGGGSGKDTIGRIEINEFDAGKDFEFYRAYIPIPDRWRTDVNSNKTFRIRITVQAKDDKDPIVPADEEDAFYVDNIYVVDINKPELEVSAVGARWPYTIAPASQARAIPLYVKVSNNGNTAATAFGVAMYVINRGAPPPPGQYSYYRFRSVISLGPGQDRTETFPTWNAQECGTEIRNADPNKIYTDQYRIFAQLLPQGLDSYSPNDLNYNDFTLTLGAVFAYDDTTSIRGKNDVAGMSGIQGKGLNLVPPAEDPTAGSAYGPIGGNLSGSFAMKFQILTRDTIRGFQAYYGAANQSPDYILYSIYKGKDDPDAPPDTVIKATRRYAQRGQGVPTMPPTPGIDKPYNFDQYVTYMLDKEVVVDPGYYFVTVSQLGETGLELGGSARNQGQVTTIRDDVSNPRGLGNYSIPAHPEMFERRFWFETIAETGNWSEMLQPTTNPGFAHLTYGGIVASINTNTRGSWTPMIRPFFGAKEAGACTVEPVELATFDVVPMASALRLNWATASEINNRGFHIERRTKGDGSEWNTIGFKEGAGTSNRERTYTHVDSDVRNEVVYQYRLRQEDLDGSVDYSPIREGRLAGATTGAIANRLEQNTPNPFSNQTEIGYTLAQSGNATLAIYDVYGNVVRSFAISAQGGQPGSIEWDGRDASGSVVPNGVYMYTLSGQGFTLSHKLTVTR